jgi:hypothetical protein
VTLHVHHGIVIAGQGSAILTVEHDDEDLLVTGIERLPFDLTTVVDRVGEFPHDPGTDLFVVDAEGLGSALWTALGSPDRRRGWSL